MELGSSPSTSRLLLCPRSWERQEKRITASEALGHPWMAGDASELAKRDLGPNMDKLRLFNARRKFKSAISSVSEFRG